MGRADSAEDPSPTPECCIYRIPKDIRKENPNAYSPKVFSIGPLNHGNPRLRSFESRKLVYFKKYIEGTNTRLPLLLKNVESLEPFIRNSYSENLGHVSRSELMKIITVDAGFILGLFLEYCSPISPSTHDRESPRAFLIRSDLCLLENQIPFPVLWRVYLSGDSNYGFGDFIPLLQLISSYFRPSFELREDLDNYGRTIMHFVDFHRACYIQPLSGLPERSYLTSVLEYSASKLYEARLKFEVHVTGRSLIDLQFSGHVLKIPQLEADETTGILFLNILALEQCHYPSESYFTDYVALLCRLIRTNEDVDVLVKHHILLTAEDFSSDVVRKFFNSVGKTLVHVDFNSDHNHLCRNLNAFCRKPWRRVVATVRRDYYLDFKRNYCNTPLQTLVTVGGILLLVLTLIQTVCSILQVV